MYLSTGAGILTLTKLGTARLGGRTIVSSFTRCTLKCLLIAITALSALTAVASAQCLRGSLPQANFFHSTGDPILDKQLDTEARAIGRVLEVSPKLYILDDGDQPNAYAVPPSADLPSGAVCLGIRLLSDVLKETNGAPEGVDGILAHEFGHILQAKLNSPLSGKWRELHADYMAGYCLGKRRMHMNAFAWCLYKLGDYGFSNPTHHGTPASRNEAMVQGYLNSGSSLEEAFFYAQKMMLQFAEEERSKAD